MHPERCQIDGQGHMVQTLLPGLPGRGGSMQTKREFGFGRWIARVRPTAVPGALNSIFTKDWDDLTTTNDDSDGKHVEVDIEFLSRTFGSGCGGVHLAIHLKDKINSYVADIPLDFDPSAAFHDWGFDILPDRVVWHVDGKYLHEWFYDETHKIDEGYEFFFNSWTMQKWIDGATAADAHYLIDSVRYYPLEVSENNR